MAENEIQINYDFYNRIADYLNKMHNNVTQYLPIICLSKIILND